MATELRGGRALVIQRGVAGGSECQGERGITESIHRVDPHERGTLASVFRSRSRKSLH